MASYPAIAQLAPQLAARVTSAVESLDVTALESLDAKVRELVVQLVARPGRGAAGVLAELGDLYRGLRERTEVRRDGLLQQMGQQRRTQNGVLAYRSSGATSRNA